MDALRSFSGDVMLWRAEVMMMYGPSAVKPDHKPIHVHGMTLQRPITKNSLSQTCPQTKARATQTPGASFRSHKRSYLTQTEASIHPSTCPVPMQNFFVPLPVPVMGPSMLPVSSTGQFALAQQAMPRPPRAACPEVVDHYHDDAPQPAESDETWTSDGNSPLESSPQDVLDNVRLPVGNREGECSDFGPPHKDLNDWGME